MQTNPQSGPYLLRATGANDRVPQPSVGVFDSGVGGLSVVRELVRLRPDYSIVYLADQAHAPYGDRDLADIRALCDAITRFLAAHGPEVIVLACNSASAAALYWLREQYPNKLFVGMEPAIKPAAARSRHGRIGVIATAATFRGAPYAGVLARHANGCEVIARVCPEFVPLVESGDLDSAHARDVVTQQLASLAESGIDELVLGCTHYSFLAPLIAEVMGTAVEIIDPSEAVARQAVRMLEERHRNVEAAEARAEHIFFTTDSRSNLRQTLAELLPITAQVEKIQWIKQEKVA
jgi:glutamate racemase